MGALLENGVHVLTLTWLLVWMFAGPTRTRCLVRCEALCLLMLTELHMDLHGCLPLHCLGGQLPDVMYRVDRYRAAA